MSKIDESLFSAHEHALDKEYHVCPECGGELSVKNSKAGTFLGCSNYPNCNYIRHTHEHGVVKEFPDRACPECDAHLALKQGRYGLFIGCSNFPHCHHIESLEQADDTNIRCPKCKSNHMVTRKSRYGKTFYACDGYPKCKFAVNHKPVEGECQFCQFPLLVEKQKGTYCAKKGCEKAQPDK